MKQRLIPAIVLSVVLAMPNPAYALFGEENAWMAQLVAWAKNNYNAVMDSLKEARSANENLRQVKEVAGRAYAEYDAVQNAALTDWQGMVERDLDALTQLDNMQGANREQQIRIMLAELDQRIADPKTSPEERANLRRQQELLKQKQEVDALRAACAENLKKSAGATDERQLTQMQAQCSAAQAVIDANAESRALDQERAAAEGQRRRNESVKDAAAMLREMSKNYGK